MPDRKPPRVPGDERETITALLQFQRDSMVRKVSGVDEEQARRSPVASGTTLLWLVTHMANAESLWVLHRFAGEPDAEDAAADHNAVSLRAAVQAYRDTWPRVDAVIAASSLDTMCRQFDDSAPVNLRWVVLHLLEETARHAGHADILRELIDGETGR
jgi:uncharacterized damage-inducible protein DinB